MTSKPATIINVGEKSISTGFSRRRKRNVTIFQNVYMAFDCLRHRFRVTALLRRFTLAHHRPLVSQVAPIRINGIEPGSVLSARAQNHALIGAF